MRFWRSISGVSWSRVAKWSCQKSVIFSWSGRCVRTMRSSHQSWSWPHSLMGSIGLPSTVGAGPTRFGPPRPLTSHFTAASWPAAAQRRASSGVAPNPARQKRRRACFSDQGMELWIGAAPAGLERQNGQLRAVPRCAYGWAGRTRVRVPVSRRGAQQHGGSRMKRFITIAVAAAALAVPTGALADSSGSHASCEGATHGAFADVNGNFGFLGAVGGTPGYHNGAVGQDPGATGY